MHGEQRHWLSAAEHLRLAGIKAPRRRDQFLAGRWLGRLALADFHGGSPEDWRLSAPPDAAPRVTRGPVFHPGAIGLSHSGDTIACVLADASLGVDVERHDRRALNVEGMAEIVLSDSEVLLWQKLPENSRQVGFLAWWTLKEAWLKAQGRAIDTGTLRRINAHPSGSAVSNARLWQATDFTLALVGLDAAASLNVASHSPIGEPQWWRIDEFEPPKRGEYPVVSQFFREFASVQ